MNMDSHTKGKIMQPFISIVVPVYNVEKYINRCIDSVLDQSYANWELLLIDDGSSDNSGKICDSYSRKDNRIRTIHKPNGGVSSARNLGIEQASGDFITFIDSDDWVESQYIADFIRCNPQRNSIVVSGLITKTPSEEYISFQYADESTMTGVAAHEIICKYDLFRDGGPSNKLFDLQLIKVSKLTFRTDLSYHEDHIFVYSYYLLVENIMLSRFCGYYYAYNGKDSNNSLSRIGKLQVQKLFDASDCFLSIIPDLFAKFKISDEKYKAEVLTRTGYSQRILAIYNLYFHSHMPHEDGIRILRREKEHIRQIKKKYYPLSTKRKIILNILSLPVMLSHMILSFTAFLTKKIHFKYNGNRI